MRDAQRIQIVPTPTFVIIYRAHINILFYLNGKISCSLSGHIPPPQKKKIMLTSEPRMISIFWTCSPISSMHMFLWCPFLDPHLTTYRSNISVQIIVVLELRPPTLPNEEETNYVSYLWPCSLITNLLQLPNTTCENFSRFRLRL